MDAYFNLKYQQEVFGACFMAGVLTVWLLYVLVTALIDWVRDLQRRRQARKAAKR